MASLVSEHELQVYGLQCLWHTGVVVLWHMGLPEPGIKAVSPELVSVFLTTGPLGKPLYKPFKNFTLSNSNISWCREMQLIFLYGSSIYLTC